MLAVEILVGKFLAVDGFAAGALGNSVKKGSDVQEQRTKILTLPRVKSPP